MEAKNTTETAKIKKPTNDLLKSKQELEELNPDEENDEAVLTSVQQLNVDIFKHNSNKSRNLKIKNAWKTISEYKLPDEKNLNIQSSHPGHFVTKGCDTGSLKNPHWKVINTNAEEYYIMACGENNFTYFSIDDYGDIINPVKNVYPTWHYHAGTGYISTRTYPGNGDTMTYLHQIICKKYNNKEYITQSVDHINQNKLDNRKENLRFASQSIQNSNRGKCKRKSNACNLPDGLVQSDLPKYVVYYKEKYGKEKDKVREWFNLERHPALDKRWSTSKSMNVSIQQKLVLIKEKIQELEA